jgi:hypothetical protein
MGDPPSSTGASHWSTKSSDRVRLVGLDGRSAASAWTGADFTDWPRALDASRLNS